jgi:Trk K+ transport system NAD-binding subunit
LALVALVLGLDTLVLVSAHTSAVDALVESLRLLTFQSSVDVQHGIGPLLYAANVIFALFFIQTLILSARAFFKQLEPQVQQRGLASVCTDHVIVCGLGRLGLRVVTRLVEAGNTVVVIELQWPSEFLARALEMHVPVVAGDARNPSVLRAAGIQRACAVVSGIDDDLADVEIALAARALRPNIRVILRAFSETFDQALDRHFGENAAFSVSALAAPTFAAAMISRGAEHVLPLGTSLLGVGDLRPSALPMGPPAPTVGEFERQYNLRVVAYSDGAGRMQTALTGRRLQPTDRIAFVGTLDRIEALRGVLRGAAATGAESVPLLQHPTATFDTFVVCGHGKVGYRVVRWLLTQTPRPKIVVVHEGKADTMRAPELQALVQSGAVEEVVGDATAPDVLRRAHLDRAYVVASVTSNDLVNLQVAMEARRQRPDVHVVLRVFSDPLADNLVALFGIHTVFSTSDLASATLAAAAEVTGVSQAFAVDGRLYAMQEITLAPRDRLVGMSVDALRKRYGAMVIGVRRAGTLTVLPADDAALLAGDIVAVVSNLKSLTSLRNS